MSQPAAPADAQKTPTSQAIEVIVKVGVILAIAVWSFDIVRPFVGPILWAVIIAVGYYPLVRWLGGKLGGRKKTAAALATLLGLAILIVPSLTLGVAAVDTAREVATKIQEGTLEIPSASEKAKEVPVVGEQLYAFWELAATNLGEAAKKAAPQLKFVGTKALGAGLGLFLGFLQFAFSLIVAGVFMATADDIRGALVRVAGRISDPAKGEHLLNMSVNTVRSVVKGILGVAVLQSIAGGLGMSVAGVPGAGLWAAIVLVLAVIQLPPALVLLPASFWAFGEHGAMWGTLFLVWNLVVILSEQVLKPILFGRGVEAPMLVVFVGAIGGMLAAGIIGLFIGPVILSLFWVLLQEWLKEGEDGAARDTSETEGPESGASDAGGASGEKGEA